MRTMPAATGRLLVDWEHGNVLRADDHIEISHRHIDVHPFIKRGDEELVVGKGPTRTIYRVLRDNQFSIEAQKVEDQ